MESQAHSITNAYLCRHIHTIGTNKHAYTKKYIHVKSHKVVIHTRKVTLVLDASYTVVTNMPTL